MDNLGCKGMDTRDSYGRDRFLPISLETHLTLGMLEDTWLWTCILPIILSKRFALSAIPRQLHVSQ